MITISPSSIRLRRPLLAVRAAVASAALALRRHHYSAYDLQYVFLALLFSFCYSLLDTPFWLKLPISAITLSLLIPKQTRVFMLPSLAVAGWLTLFYCCRFIPAEWRPHIYTSVLPALDNILYGANLSDLLASGAAPWKDLLAWLPYGIFHFVMPAVVAVLVTIYGPAGTLPVFARTFGYMNVAGVLTQLFFPCAPPWYETRYGPLQPAAYSMPGDPGGLTRVDDILGTNMYRSTFTASPLVFGAFPSLHSGCAWQLAFFTVFVFGPRSIPLALLYVFWIWWAAMYLGHHYVVDLVGGGVYAIFAFWIGSSFLPSALPLDNIQIDALGRRVTLKASLYEPIANGTVINCIEDWEIDSTQQGDSDDDVTEGSPDTVVVGIGEEIEVYSATISLPPEVASRSQISFESWNGWHGYEYWVLVLMSVKAGTSIPRSRPRSSSPRLIFKSPMHGLPLTNRALRSRSPLNLDISTRLGIACSDVDTAAHTVASESSTPSTTLSPVSTSPSPSLADARDLASPSTGNVAIATATGSAILDNDSKHTSRPVHMSLLSSPLSTLPFGPVSDIPAKANVAELEICAGSPGSPASARETSRDSGPGLLLAGSSSGLLVSTAPLPSPSNASIVGSGKGFKAD